MNREERERTKGGWERPPYRPGGEWRRLRNIADAIVGMPIRWISLMPRDNYGTPAQNALPEHVAMYDGVIERIDNAIHWRNSRALWIPGDSRDCWAEVK